jgi:hypothetical protein
VRPDRAGALDPENLAGSQLVAAASKKSSVPREPYFATAINPFGVIAEIVITVFSLD